MIQHKGKKYAVFDVEEFNEVIKTFKSKDKIAVHLLRNGSRLIQSISLN